MPFLYNAGDLKAERRVNTIPDGWYLFKVAQIITVDWTAKVPYTRLRSNVEHGKFKGKGIFHAIFMPDPKDDEGGSSNFLYWLKCINQPHQGKFEVKAKAWKDALFYGRVITKDDKQYGPQNKIVSVMSCEEFEAAMEKEDGEPRDMKEKESLKEAEEALTGPDKKNPDWLG